MSRARRLSEKLTELSRLDVFRRDFKRQFKGGTSRKIREFIRDFGALPRDKFIEKAEEFFTDLDKRGNLPDDLEKVMKAVKEIA